MILATSLGCRRGQRPGDRAAGRSLDARLNRLSSLSRDLTNDQTTYANIPSAVAAISAEINQQQLVAAEQAATVIRDIPSDVGSAEYAPARADPARALRLTPLSRPDAKQMPSLGAAAKRRAMATSIAIPTTQSGALRTA
jgi:hypothetical protein